MAGSQWVRVQSPGIGGVVTDLPPWQLKPQQVSFAKNMIPYLGLMQVRWGWDYDGTQEVQAGQTNSGVVRVRFVISAVTQTLVASSQPPSFPFSIYVHNPTASGTDIGIGAPIGALHNLPRCVYADRVWFLAQDGVSPAFLYSGVAANGAATGVNFTAGQAIVTASAGSWAAGIVRGAYYKMTALAAVPNRGAIVYPRVGQRISSTVLGIENIKTSAGGALAAGGFAAQPAGRTYPCVNIYDEGTITLSGGNLATLTGGDWTAPLSGVEKAILVLGAASIVVLDAVFASATTATIVTNRTDANVRHNILARCPFKDACAFKDSLFGTGVKGKEGVVFVSPPNWDPAFPPGLPLPFDPSVEQVTTTGDPDLFRLDEINVPAKYDGDPCVAVIPTQNCVLVAKSASVYGIFGSYPNFDVRLLMAGDGCIDIRSAQSGPEGAFFAGRKAVYTWDGTRIIDITTDKIGVDYRQQAQLQDSTTAYMPAAVTSVGYLLQLPGSGALLSGGGAGWALYDYRRAAWYPLDLPLCRYIYASRIPGEAERILATGVSLSGRVMDFAPALLGLKPTGAIADPIDDDTLGPANSGMKLPVLNGDPDREVRFTRIAVTVNLYDLGAAGASVMSVSNEFSGRVNSYTKDTMSVGTMQSDQVDSPDRYGFKVGVAGRRHQVTLLSTQVGSSARRAAIAEVALKFRARREGR